MNICRNSKLLDDLWNSSISITGRDLKDFDGIYRVQMATGVVPQLPNWRKYISNTRDMLPMDDNQVSGYNVIFRKGYGFPGKTFGNFGVRLYHYSLPQKEPLYTGLVLVYNNGLFKDYLRKIAPDLFLGKFYLVLRGREIFMGYFWLYATEPYRRDRGKVYKDRYFRADLDTDDQGYGLGNEDINIMDDIGSGYPSRTVEETDGNTIKIKPLTEKQKEELLTIAEIREKEQIWDSLEDIPNEIVRKSDKVVELDKAKEDDLLMDGWVED